MVRPIRSQHDVSLAYRRRSRRPRRSPFRPLGAVLLVLALVGLVALVDRGLSQPRPVRAAPRLATVPAAPATDGVPLLRAAGFEPSACLSYPPTSGDRGRTVFLDPGHGGPDPGAVGPSGGGLVREKDATLAVATRLTGLLRARGYRVVLARTGDTLVTAVTEADLDSGALRPSAEHRDLLARVSCANAARASVLLSIHFNGFEDPAVGGTEVVYDAARPFSDQNRRLAGLLQAALVHALGLADRGILPDDQLDAPTLTDAGNAYGHLLELGPAQAGWLEQPSAMPGALAEPLFVSNADQAQLISQPAGQAAVAAALAGAVLQFLDGL